MESKNNKIITCLKEGTILWVKISLIIVGVLGVSYLLSKLYFLLGILFHFYFFVFVSPVFISVPLKGTLIGSIIDLLSIIIFPVYLFIAVNYFYLYNKNKTIWWLTVLFVVSTILYIIGILAGWFIFFVWHP